MKYKFLDTSDVDKRLIEMAKEKGTLSADDPKYYDLDEDYVVMSKFGVEGGASIWKDVGTNGVEWTNPQDGLKYKRDDFFAIRGNILYLLAKDKGGNIIGVVNNSYVHYGDTPQYTKKMVEKSAKAAQAQAIENAAKASQQVDAVNEVTNEGIIETFTTKAQNKVLDNMPMTPIEKRLQTLQNKLLGIELSQKATVDVVIEWTDVIGARHSTTSRVDVASGQTIGGVTNTWLLDQQKDLQPNTMYNYRLEIFDLDGSLIVAKAGQCKKGDAIRV